MRRYWITAGLLLLPRIATAAEEAPDTVVPITNRLWQILSLNNLYTAILTLSVTILGGILLRVLSKAAGRAVARRWSEEPAVLIRKGIMYAGWIIIILTVLSQMGVQLTAILAAAGVAGVAIGFAAQTSLSNIISGVFLSIERPFKVGDMIQVGDTLGIVLSVDLMSVKMRQFDNRFVRIPNENLIKTQVTNYSRYPIRRVDLLLGVAYKENIDRVRELLLEIAGEHPLALQEPEPLCFCWEFADSAVNMLFVVWATKDDYLTLKDELLRAVKRRFDEEGIEIPFPHLSLYTGEATKPLPIDLGPETIAKLQTLAGQALPGGKPEK